MTLSERNDSLIELFRTSEITNLRNLMNQHAESITSSHIKLILDRIKSKSINYLIDISFYFTASEIALLDDTTRASNKKYLLYTCIPSDLKMAFESFHYYTHEDFIYFASVCPKEDILSSITPSNIMIFDEYALDILAERCRPCDVLELARRFKGSFLANQAQLLVLNCCRDEVADLALILGPVCKCITENLYDRACSADTLRLNELYLDSNWFYDIQIHSIIKVITDNLSSQAWLSEDELTASNYHITRIIEFSARSAATIGISKLYSDIEREAKKVPITADLLHSFISEYSHISLSKLENELLSIPIQESCLYQNEDLLDILSSYDPYPLIFTSTIEAIKKKIAKEEAPSNWKGLLDIVSFEEPEELYYDEIAASDTNYNLDL